jgi:class 3 adenylate cyclase
MGLRVDAGERQGPVREALPTGTVTFVLGDVAGSTRLWEDHPQAMPAVLERLDELVDRADVSLGWGQL